LKEKEGLKREIERQSFMAQARNDDLSKGELERLRQEFNALVSVDQERLIESVIAKGTASESDLEKLKDIK
jgi:hypothetical protein